MKKLTFIFVILFYGLSYSQVVISLPTAVGAPNSENLFPITVSDLTGQNVTSFQFQINYNKSAAYITGISTTGTLVGSNSPTIKVDTVNAYLRVSWASAYPLTGSGTLFNIRIKFRNSGSTVLQFGDIDYGNGNINPKMFGPQTLQVTWQNGTATVSTTNNPPVFSAVGNKTVNEGETLTFTVSATDPENDAITYGIQNKPPGADFNPSTKTFTWTPNFNQQGTYVVTFTASDGVNTSVLNVTITVNNVNRPPTLNLNTTSPVNINEGQSYSLQLTATDPDSGATLIFFGTGLPLGAEITSTGLFTWKPNYNQAGSYIITFTVMDEYNATDSKNLIINVADANQPPVFTKTIPKDTIITVHNVPVTFTFQYKAVDPEGDPLTFAQVKVPDNAGINATGLFTWTPSQDQANKTFQIIIAVFDGHNIVYDTTSVKTSPVVSVNENAGIPLQYELYQNYPNPFNPSTTIHFALPEEANVTLKVYNSMGKEVATLVNRILPAGYHSVVFNAVNMVSGIYFYKIEAGNYKSIRKMLLMK